MKVAFTNAEGKRFELDGSLTLQQLLKLGFVRVKLVDPDKPLESNEWRLDISRTQP